MKYIINPQIIFIYNNHGKIYKTIFLSYNKEIKDTKEFIFFNYLINKNYNMFHNKEYEIIKNHILLTLNISEIRGCIQKILQINKKIIVFSLYNNIDYENTNQTIFNPFNINSIFKKINENKIIYDIYQDICSLCIFCIVDEINSPNKNICLNGNYSENFYNFTNSILSIDISDEYEIKLNVEYNDKNVYNIDKTKNLTYLIQKISLYNKIINENSNKNILITGDDLILLNNKDIFYNIISVYDNNKNIIFIIKDNNIFIHNNINYEKIILSYSNFKNIIINQKNIKNNTKIIFNLTFKNIVILDDNDFFIEPTKKTKNIFIDRTKNINIITSSKHIIFKSFNDRNDLFFYITKFIIGYQIFKNNILFSKLINKEGNRYFSRYCQKSRKPVIINIKDINLSEYIDKKNYLENKEDPNQIIYLNKENQYLYCPNKNLKYIGFINELLKGYNFCLPCCYIKPKKDTKAFKKCMELNDTSLKKSNIILDPYIHIFKYYRIVIDNKKIAILLDKINILFNKRNNLLYQYDKKSIKNINYLDIINLKNDILNINNNNFITLNEENLIININDTNPKSRKILKESIMKNLENFSNFLLINKHNKIELAKRYAIYTLNDSLIDIQKIDDIYNLNINGIFFLNNIAYFKKDLIDKYFYDKKNFLKNLNFYLIIQNKVHIIKNISKINYNDDITIDDFTIDEKENIIKDFFRINPFSFNKNEFDNVIFNENQFYYKNNIININNKTKYYYNFEKYSLKKNTIGYFIINNFSNYFDSLYLVNDNNLDLIKKTFLNNLRNILDFDVNFNENISKINKDFLFKILEYLNKKFTNYNYINNIFD